MVQAEATVAAISTLLKKGRIAASRLLPLVYEDLRQLARARVAKLAHGHTMRATELVHEAWMRVVANGDPGWDGRAHFFGAAANAMRNILVEQARRRGALKRDVSRKEALVDDMPEVIEPLPFADILSLHEAMLELEREHARPAQVVELRFFSGLSMPEIAQALATSLPTVERDWRFARAWLQDRLGAAGTTDD
jgi:RNA polymerase sigma factor (TIGR02999 family)